MKRFKAMRKILVCCALLLIAGLAIASARDAFAGEESGKIEFINTAKTETVPDGAIGASSVYWVWIPLACVVCAAVILIERWSRYRRIGFPIPADAHFRTPDGQVRRITDSDDIGGLIENLYLNKELVSRTVTFTRDGIPIEVEFRSDRSATLREKKNPQSESHLEGLSLGYGSNLLFIVLRSSVSELKSMFNPGMEPIWNVKLDGRTVATLSEPRFEEMFYTSYRIEPLVDNEDERQQILSGVFFRENIERIQILGVKTGEIGLGYAWGPPYAAQRRKFRGIYLQAHKNNA